MRRDIKDFADLTRVTGVAFAAGQARMAALRRRENEIRAHIADLDRPRHDLTIPIAENAALRAGADLTWQLWVDNRRSALNVDLARCLVSQEVERQALSRAFGRDQAAQSIRDKGIAAARLERDKRQERND